MIPVSRHGGSFCKVSISTYRHANIHFSQLNLTKSLTLQFYYYIYHSCSECMRSYLHWWVFVIRCSPSGQFNGCYPKTPDVCFEVIAADLPIKNGTKWTKRSIFPVTPELWGITGRKQGWKRINYKTRLAPAPWPRGPSSKVSPQMSSEPCSLSCLLLLLERHSHQSLVSVRDLESITEGIKKIERGYFNYLILEYECSLVAFSSNCVWAKNTFFNKSRIFVTSELIKKRCFNHPSCTLTHVNLQP